MASLPSHEAKFFWDVKPADLDVEKDWFFIVERLLEYGDDRSLAWLKKNYPDKDIVEVVMKSKKLSRKTANIWRIYYDLRLEEVTCLQKSYNQNSNVFWSF
jgi:hypothetical protein